MNTAIIYLKNSDEKLVSTAKYLDITLFDLTLKRIRKAGFDKCYVVGANIEEDGVIVKSSISDVFEEVSKYDGVSVLVSPLYPNIKSYHYKSLLNLEEENVVLCCDGEIVNIFKVSNHMLNNLNDLQLNSFEIEKSAKIKIDSLALLEKHSADLRVTINKKLQEKGVNIIDINNTYISYMAIIKDGATIYPNVYIEGDTIIGKNCVITSGSHLINSIIGQNVNVISSRIENSIVKNGEVVGPFAYLKDSCADESEESFN